MEKLGNPAPDVQGSVKVVSLTPDGGVLKRIIEPGDGGSPPTGSTVQVKYVGWTNGKEFDRNHGGYPFEFELGANAVVAGWEVAVPEMKVGERAQLTIAAAFGYGEAGSGDDVPPGATLVFDVTIVGFKLVAGVSEERLEEERTRLDGLKADREGAAAKAAADKVAKEKAKDEMKAKMQAKLQAKGQKGKGQKGKKKEKEEKAVVAK
jgi:hypothetical protein